MLPKPRNYSLLRAVVAGFWKQIDDTLYKGAAKFDPLVTDRDSQTFSGSIDQNQNAQNVRSDLWSALSERDIFLS